MKAAFQHQNKTHNSHVIQIQNFLLDNMWLTGSTLKITQSTKRTDERPNGFTYGL